jgi:hypothetical protein
MDWREAVFVTVFTVLALALLKLALTAGVEAHGLLSVPIITGAAVAVCYFVIRWANRGFETIQPPSQPALRSDDEPERLDSSPSVLALPPPEPTDPTSLDRRE